MKADPSAASLIPLIVADIFELAGRLRESGEAIARTVDQTQARWQVLSAASADPLTVPQIARRLGVTRQNVQRIADLLVKENWAKFQSNPDHRASPLLVLTERGEAALEKLTKAATSSHTALAQRLSATEIETAHQALRRLIIALNELETSED
jgi:DNA-binding MarR family transcriptional regulator